MNKLFGWAVAANIAMAVASPAAAAVTTFASFNATTAGNIVWANNGTGGTSSTYRANGTGGSLFTYAPPAVPGTFNPNTAAPGTVDVTFKFLQPSLSEVDNVAATFTMNLSVTNSPATQMTLFDQTHIAQWGLAGSFSFKTSEALLVNGQSYAAGANLLTATFINDQTIMGQKQATSGGLTASTNSGATIIYTSDFMDFSNSVSRDAAFSLSAIQSLVGGVNKGLNQSSATTALRSFRATATGSFSHEAVETIAAVPEPATWAMMLGGFSLIGGMARRGKRTRSVLA